MAEIAIRGGTVIGRNGHGAPTSSSVPTAR